MFQYVPTFWDCVALIQKRRGGEFEMKIHNILNTNSTRIVGNFQRVERKLQQILFLNLNPSN
jgi:hypothetical protein